MARKASAAARRGILAAALALSPLLLTAAPPPRPYSSQAPTPTFDAVSIKPAAPRLEIFGKIVDPERLEYPDASLYAMALDAYGLSAWQVTGGPAWLNQTYFALNAETLAPVDKAERMRMLRRVLQRRFGLKLQATVRTGDVYRLVVAKGGAKLSDKPADVNPPPGFTREPPTIHLADGSIPPLMTENYYRSSGNGTGRTTVDQVLFARQATTGDIVQGLSNLLGAPVTDATGLHGKYNFFLHYGRPGPVAYAPAVSAAMKSQLGLELVKSKGSYTVYTVVSAHRPSGN